MTYDHIAARIKQLQAHPVAELKTVASKFGVYGGKTKKEILASIEDKITRRKTTHARTQF